MADIKSCDRCNALIGWNSRVGQIKFTMDLTDFMGENTSFFPTGNKDLCEECHKQFIKWWNNK